MFFVLFVVVGWGVFAQVWLVCGLVLLFGVCFGLGLVVGCGFLFTSGCWGYVGVVGCGCGGLLGLFFLGWFFVFCWVVFSGGSTCNVLNMKLADRVEHEKERRI